MDLVELEPYLQQVTSVDINAAFTAFKRTSGSENIDEFLVFLRDRGYVSAEAFQELLGLSGSVEITSYEIVAEGDSGASSDSPLSDRGAARAYAEVSQLARATRDSKATIDAKYTVLGFVAEGGMGQIYVAKDLLLRRNIALKRLKRAAAQQTEAVARFFNEAQITAQLDHPNIVPVHSLEASRARDIAYSMKLVQGKTLKKLLEETKDLYTQNRPIDEGHNLDERLQHFLKVCDAIGFAHAKGVIHRDLKPENVMIGRYNELYVMDWGIARILHPSATKTTREDTQTIDLSSADGKESSNSELTMAGAVLGTPRYMSPEQAQGEQLDNRSDLYALGLILFELVSLKKAVPGKTGLDILTNAAHAVKEPLTPPSPRESIAIDLEAIIDKATQKWPPDRYATAKELADDLRRYMRGDPVKARRDTLVQKLGRILAKNRRAAVFGIIAIFLIATAISTISALYGRAGAMQQRETAAKEERNHADRVNRLTLDVAQRTQALNAKLLQIETIVEGVSQATSQALNHGKEVLDPIYFDTAFANSATRPAGLIQSGYYGGPVSIDFPVWTAAPGIVRETLLPTIRRLNSIRGTLRESCLARHATPGNGALEVAQQGGPIQWCYVGLAEGAVAVYPGSASIPEGYDPRTRPWYTLSVGKSRATWGNPYIEKLRGEKVLPCSVSLVDPGGKFLGVAGVNVRFDYIIQALSTDDVTGMIRETYITDENGRVIVQSSGARIRTGAGELHNPLKLEDLPLPEVVKQIRDKRPRGTWLDEDSKDQLLVAFNRIDELGWYHVVTARVNEPEK